MLGGSDRSIETVTPKLNSFKRLNGDPAKGIEGGVLCHALRSELIMSYNDFAASRPELTPATGATTCNLVHVAAGELDISW